MHDTEDYDFVTWIDSSQPYDPFKKNSDALPEGATNADSVNQIYTCSTLKNNPDELEKLCR